MALAICGPGFVAPPGRAFVNRVQRWRARSAFHAEVPTVCAAGFVAGEQIPARFNDAEPSPAENLVPRRQASETWLSLRQFNFGRCQFHPAVRLFDDSVVLIFGHFLVPFLALLRIDMKLIVKFMLPLAAWIGLMQYVDLAFNISPVLHPNGFPWRWLWLDAGCIAFMGGVLARAFSSRSSSLSAFAAERPQAERGVGSLSHPGADVGPANQQTMTTLAYILSRLFALGLLRSRSWLAQMRGQVLHS